ncbi:hypothetical protein [Salinigranum rubrum]|uniref:hypothetical protein n=1 Tax=Salinigranum rubrum TaxID=755307 RepID=UPI0013A57B01|nr:hypothetical protein [Salinigranum rubrum]
MKSNIVLVPEVLPALFHFFALGASVVVTIKDVLADVYPVADHFDRDVFEQV